MRAYYGCTNRGRNGKLKYRTVIIFSCTKKVRDKLKRHREINDEKYEPGNHNWYIDLIRIDRCEHLLFTNSILLYSVIVYIGGSMNNVESLFKNRLSEAIIENYGEELSKRFLTIISNEEQFIYTKTNSRKILGSMNDYKWQIEVQRQYNKLGMNEIKELGRRLNECPMSMIKYSSGKREMEKLVTDF